MKQILHNKCVITFSVLLSGLMIASVGYAASRGYAKGAAVASGGTDLQSAIEDTVQIDSSAAAKDKEETVYAISDASGGIQQIIVSDWLKNPSAKASLTDYTELSGISSTNGDETFTASGKNTYVWNAQGKDIHYQGTTQKALPVTVAVTYTLNGQQIAPEKLLGQSGHVGIRFSYTNNQKVSASIDGKTETIDVPFLMISGLVLDGETFSNVTVSNGTVYNDGSRNIVIGCAFPGLPESLDVTGSDIDIPESVEISADTTDFALSGTLTIGTTDVFQNVKVNTGSLSDLSDSLHSLETAAQALVGGTADVFNGSSDLAAGCSQLSDGIASVLEGAKGVKDGAADVNSGAASLRTGLRTLSASSDSINDGARQLVDSVFSSTTTLLRQELVADGLMTPDQAAAVTLTRSNYVSVFAQLSSAATITEAQAEAQLRGSLSPMTAAQQDLALTIAYDLMAADASLSCTDALEQAVQMMADAQAVPTDCAVIDAKWVEDHADLITQIEATGADSQTAAKIAAIAIALDSSNPGGKMAEASAILANAATVAATVPSTDKISALCTAAANAATKTGNAKLDAVKTQLDKAVEYYNGVLNYTGGVDSAYDGAKDLAKGASALADGAKQLYDGVYTLYAGSRQLVTGAGTLKDGAEQLKDGMQQFYDEGIETLVNSLGGNTRDLLDRLSAVVNAGRDYQTFAGKSTDMSGSVKFVFRTDSIDK